MDIALLRNSFEFVIERQPDLVTCFYEILFDRYPAARALFRGPTRTQEQMLTAALVAVLDHLEDAAWLSRTLGALGARHVHYGVTDEMYDWVGECLLAAMAEAAGDAWSDVLTAEWTAAYGAIAGTMKAGAARDAQAA
jgi:hemoglobin-like flavoprotein